MPRWSSCGSTAENSDSRAIRQCASSGSCSRPCALATFVLDGSFAFDECKGRTATCQQRAGSSQFPAPCSIPSSTAQESAKTGKGPSPARRMPRLQVLGRAVPATDALRPLTITHKRTGKCLDQATCRVTQLHHRKRATAPTYAACSAAGRRRGTSSGGKVSAAPESEAKEVSCS